MNPCMLHLSIPVKDIVSSLYFYGEVLGCVATRVQDDRIDIDFFGHHLVAQLSPQEAAHESVKVGSNEFPLRHFGVIVEEDTYERMLGRLQQANVSFAMMPKKIFVGTPREQSVFLVYDPSGNAVEVKGLAAPKQVFSAT